MHKSRYNIVFNIFLAIFIPLISIEMFRMRLLTVNKIYARTFIENGINLLTNLQRVGNLNLLSHLIHEHNISLYLVASSSTLEFSVWRLYEVICRICKILYEAICRLS